MRDRLVYPDLMRPEFSARECAKQLILLEDHLSVPGKQCPDCVSKHRLAAEAFAEEVLHLGSGAPWAADLPIRIRSAQSAQDYRSVRKDLTARLREVGMAGVEQTAVDNWEAVDTGWGVPNDTDWGDWKTFFSEPVMRGGPAPIGLPRPERTPTLRESEQQQLAEWLAEGGGTCVLVDRSGNLHSTPVITPCNEDRPCPQGTQCYIPKSPGSNGGNLTWPEKLAAEEAADPPAPPPSFSWWPLLLIGACVLLVRGPLVKKLAG